MKRGVRRARAIASVTIGARAIDIESVVRVARRNSAVVADATARRRIAAARKVIERSLAQGKPVYGLTTGLGAGVDTKLDDNDVAAFQRRAILARSVGVGPKLPADLVRAMLFARIAGLAAGASGISPPVFDALLALLNAGIVPDVPARGSIGAADLAPLAHAMLALLGEGEVTLGAKRLPARDALARAGLKPVVLGPKDGLALINSNAASVGPAALAVADAQIVLASLDAAAALSCEGFRANLSPLDPRMHALRPAAGQAEAARRLSNLLRHSALWKPGAARRVQDPLSLRCIAPVHGATLAALDLARHGVEIELNGAGDNPAVLVADGEIHSNANFDVTALALAFEHLGQALAHCAALAAERMMKLMSPSVSELPRFLTPRGQSRTGFATVQKTIAALEAEIRHLALPVSLAVIPVADRIEDYATMAPRVIEKTSEIIERLRYLAAIELIVASQAIDLRQPPKLGRGAEVAHRWLRKRVPMLDEDRVQGPEFDRVAADIAAGELVAALA